MQGLWEMVQLCASRCYRTPWRMIPLFYGSQGVYLRVLEQIHTI